MIEYLAGSEPRPDASGDVEFVGGPRSGERDHLEEQADTIPADGGMYRRSVSCADDGALRYVWVRGSIPG